MKKATEEIVPQDTPVLREVALPLPENLFGSAELKKLLAHMTEALDKQLEGVALAAPQVSVSYRLFIVRRDRILPVDIQGSTLDVNSQGRTFSAPTPEVDVYINPEIVKTSRKRARMDEGCLSVKNVYGTTKRHERVTIRARHEDGTKFTRGAGGILAQIFEHEVDHLNGILFVDHAEHLIQLREHIDE
ncbi:hypothetical protein A3G63_00500 [Candidatus Kaiserbacteria bacterium RIFCSPLOWO2_12_FULL_52_8]|uniref:Peptide deformylase n=1 Tax=Candidatus Kaiserbacteria bacterium RIFCSPHIGHO2_01_FULL_53_31 TaxID=1798481 RepID=A0A1F6CIJ5_9BACT|nr:MAG: hypothetical protein A2678_01210 [Candidatus Kaiserbacteria bacterium RIFCSPHIGHO2_01_FULL_53_31]OGG92643.1 MAG: hypothetical protein A3G63_00500 [Candidatus Kaiserbacteria bacterium RIFCSPLOWO2_12_FULL_52_8]